MCESGMSVPLLTIAAFCPCAVQSPCWTGFTFSHPQTVTFCSSPPPMMWETVTQGQEVPDQQVSPGSGALHIHAVLPVVQSGRVTD